MNNCNFIGRLTRDPEVRYTQGEKPLCVTRFTPGSRQSNKKPGSRLPGIQGIRSERRICRKVPEEGNEGGNKIKSPCRFL